MFVKALFLLPISCSLISCGAFKPIAKRNSKPDDSETTDPPEEVVEPVAPPIFPTEPASEKITSEPNKVTFLDPKTTEDLMDEKKRRTVTGPAPIPKDLSEDDNMIEVDPPSPTVPQ